VVSHSLGAIISACVARVWSAWLPLLALRLRRGAGTGRAPLGGALAMARAGPPWLCAPAFPGFSCPRV
jgi:hypothetical protein